MSPRTPLILTLALAGCASAQVTDRPMPAAPAGPPGPVLFVLSAAPLQTLADGSTRPTGTFLGELYDAQRAVEALGLEVEFATPSGAPVAIDPESLDPKYWSDPAALDDAQRRVGSDPRISSPLTAAEALARADRYAGLVVPGGQGVMIDVLASADVRALVERIGVDRPVGLICHAPALLTRLTRSPFAGREVTSVSGVEEWYIETFVMGAEALDRDLHDQLEQHGFEHTSAFPGRPFAVRDGNLVTSQNPFSGEPFGRLFGEALRASVGR